MLSTKSFADGKLRDPPGAWGDELRGELLANPPLLKMGPVSIGVGPLLLVLLLFKELLDVPSLPGHTSIVSGLAACRWYS
jgi:hypothetical protein